MRIEGGADYKAKEERLRRGRQASVYGHPYLLLLRRKDVILWEKKNIGMKEKVPSTLGGDSSFVGADQ